MPTPQAIPGYSRRIRRLHLRVPSQSSARHSAHRVEDALRCASLPFADSPRIVLLRRLDLGRLPHQDANLPLADRLERRLLDATRVAVHGSNPAAHHAHCVYFADTLDLVLSLARELTHPHSPDAWFWPLAIPGFQPGQSAARAWHLIRAHLLSRPDAASNLPALIRSLFDQGRETGFLESFEPAEARAFLQSMRSPPPSRESEGIPQRTQPSSTPFSRQETGRTEPARGLLTASMRSLAMPWIRRWSPEDPRSLCLLAWLVLSSNPTLAAHPLLLHHLGTALSGEPVERSPDSPAPPCGHPSSHPENSATVPEGLPQSTPPAGHDRERSAPSPQPNPQNPGTTQLPQERRWTTRDSEGLNPAAPTSPSPSPSHARAQVTENLPHPQPSSLSPAAGHLSDNQPIRDDGSGPESDPLTPDASPSDHVTHPAQVGPEPVPVRKAAVISAPSVSSNTPPPRVEPRGHPALGSDANDVGEAHPSFAGAFTSFAGLLFLIAALRRLGWEPYLGTHPHLLETAFPARLLLHLGESAGMPPDDPWYQALEGKQTTQADFQAISEESKLWRKRLDAAFSDPASESTLASSGLSLETLIRRPGHLQHTRTHLDVTLALDSVDLRIRRLGLDLDPGWVPWLGKVVSFHYSDSP